MIFNYSISQHPDVFSKNFTDSWSMCPRKNIFTVNTVTIVHPVHACVVINSTCRGDKVQSPVKHSCYPPAAAAVRLGLAWAKHLEQYRFFCKYVNVPEWLGFSDNAGIYRTSN